MHEAKMSGMWLTDFKCQQLVLFSEPFSYPIQAQKIMYPGLLSNTQSYDLYVTILHLILVALQLLHFKEIITVFGINKKILVSGNSGPHVSTIRLFQISGAECAIVSLSGPTNTSLNLPLHTH